jgi:outer membrane protein
MSPRHLFLNLAAVALMAIPCAAQGTQSLSLADAEKIAIQNHPQIQAAGYLANAAQAQVTQARSAYYPQAVGSITGAESEHDSRISAGALNNPIIYDRFANGITVNQLVTDFGRTHELVKSSSLHAQAEKENVTTSRADVLINVDRAYYSVLRAQAVLRVAQETVKNRQLVSDQITALEQNRLRHSSCSFKPKTE